MGCATLTLARRIAGVLALVSGVGLLAVPGALAGWRIQPAPSPKHGAGSLSGVSCTSPAMCVAVGSSEDGNAPPRPIAEQWNGRRWAMQRMPSQPDVLEAVSCVSSRFCMATGIRSGRRALTDLWNGRDWSARSVPGPSGIYLSGISCTSPMACLAVGGWSGFASPGVPASGRLSERWDGFSWSVASRAPLDPDLSDIFSVSCLSGWSCLMAGGTDLGRPFAARWTGAGWERMRTPDPGGQNDDTWFNSISCSSTSSCTAVGDRGNQSLDGDSVTEPFAERWNGVRWAVQRTPVPRRSDDTELSGVSCQTKAMCAAVGSSSMFNGPVRPYVVVWSGARWGSPAIPLPRGAAEGSPDAVSCASREVCTLVGSWTGGGTRVTTHVLVERTTDALSGVGAHGG